MRTICIASTAVCLCLARPYATKAHSHSHTRASRVHHSLPHCSHPALAPHILKPLPTTTLPLRSFFSLQHSRHPQRRPFHPQPPCLHALRPAPPRHHTHILPCGGACDRQPPITTAATTGTCAHEDPKCRPHRASSASRMMMPHSSATQPQPQSSADRTSARKPQRLPPRKPPSHTHPHACTHTHTT